MAIRISTAARSACATAVRDLIDADAGPGYLEVRTGSQPATPNTAATGTVLATVAFDDPSGSVSNGVLTFDGLPNSDVSADASGTAGWFRIYDQSGDAVVDGSCSGTGGGGDMQIDNPSLVAGQTFSLTAVSTLSMPVG